MVEVRAVVDALDEEIVKLLGFRIRFLEAAAAEVAQLMLEGARAAPNGA
ncbi:MAG: hypothetical protein ACT4N8_15185 [Sphingosinicella sp.]